MDLMTLTIFLVCFLMVCGLVGLISVLGTKEQSYEDGLRASRQLAAGFAPKDAEKKAGRKNRKGSSAAALKDQANQVSSAKGKSAVKRLGLVFPDKSDGANDKSAVASQPTAEASAALPEKSGGSKKSRKKPPKSNVAAAASKAEDSSETGSGSSAVTNEDIPVVPAATEAATVEPPLSVRKESLQRPTAEDLPEDEVDERVASSSGAGTPEPTVVKTNSPEPVSEPIIQEVQSGLHMTAAGKTKAAKQKKATKPAVEDAVDESAQGELAPAEAKLPVSEPLIVKEEAVLLYDDKTESTGTQQSTPSGGGSGKQKKKRAAGGNAGGQNLSATDLASKLTRQQPIQAQDLMSAVKKTNFDDEELQNLIEVLLNKQQNNGPSLNGSWVEPQPSELKQLQKALQERDMQLEEEQTRVKALSDRYQQMQRELGESKGQLGQLQRVHADFQNQINGLEMAKRESEQNFRNLSHQSSYEIQNLGHQKDQFARQVNELQIMLRSRQPADDLKAELESAKANHASEMNNLHSQINHRSTEIAQLKQQLQELRGQYEAAEGQKDAMSKELNKANSFSKDLESKVTALEEGNTKINSEKQAELQSKIEELVKSQAGLESSLNGVTCQLRAKEKEVSSLNEAKSTLTEKLAQSEDRLKTAQEEVVAAASNGINHKEEEEAAAAVKAAKAAAESKAEAEAAAKEAALEYEAKLKRVHLEKEKLEDEICQLKSAAQKEAEVFRADVDQAKTESETYRKETSTSLANLQTELDDVKEKLRDANATLSQQRSKNDEAEKSAQSQLDEKYGEFLQRVLPGIQLSGGWQAGLESEVQAMKQRLADVKTDQDKDGEEKREVLEKQVIHYKSSLQETESLLHKLQASVEAEEAKWKQTLAEQTKELETLKQQNAKMETCVQSAEEMQEKLHQLQAKLVGHEEAKRDLEKSIAEKSDFESDEKDRLLKEIESLKEGKSELGLQVARMNQLVTAGQEALQQEQKTVDLLREQLSKASVASKAEEIVSSSSAANNEDGLTVNSVTKSNSTSSKLGSLASLDLSDGSQQQPSTPNSSEKKKRKKKSMKKKVEAAS